MLTLEQMGDRERIAERTVATHEFPNAQKRDWNAMLSGADCWGS